MPAQCVTFINFLKKCLLTLLIKNIKSYWDVCIKIHFCWTLFWMPNLKSKSLTDSTVHIYEHECGNSLSLNWTELWNWRCQVTFYSKASFFIGRKYKVQQRVYVHSFHSVPAINLLSQRSVPVFQCKLFVDTVQWGQSMRLFFNDALQIKIVESKSKSFL